MTIASLQSFFIGLCQLLATSSAFSFYNSLVHLSNLDDSFNTMLVLKCSLLKSFLVRGIRTHRRRLGFRYWGLLLAYLINTVDELVLLDLLIADVKQAVDRFYFLVAAGVAEHLGVSKFKPIHKVDCVHFGLANILDLGLEYFQFKGSRSFSEVILESTIKLLHEVRLLQLLLRIGMLPDCLDKFIDSLVEIVSMR